MVPREHDRTGNLPLFPGSSPTKWLRSFAMESTASASLLWRVGACRVRRSLAARRSPTSAMSAARIGAGGSASKTAASCPRLRFASTRTRSRARRPSGSPSARSALVRVRWSMTLGAAFEGRRARPSMGSMSCSASSRQKQRRRRPNSSQGDACILTTPAEIDLWLLADAPKALELQRPLPDDALRVVASGEKEDGPREDAVPDWDQDPISRFDAPRRFQPYHNSV